MSKLWSWTRAGSRHSSRIWILTPAASILSALVKCAAISDFVSRCLEVGMKFSFFHNLHCRTHLAHRTHATPGHPEVFALAGRVGTQEPFHRCRNLAPAH